MIDEFQFLNRHIYWDQEKTRQAKGLVGSYLHTAERKHAPLLITGSWVNWLMDDVNKLLPGRFVYAPLKLLPEEEAVEMIVNYSLIERQPVTEETTYLIADVSEGNPFYISAFFQFRFPDKDLTTPVGVRRTLEFETLHLDGSINSTWMEYLDVAFDKVNDVYAKDMVLYLSKHRHEFVPRKTLKQEVHLCEIDEEVIRISKQHFPSVASRFDHPTLRVFCEDGAQFITSRKKLYDVILVDSPDPWGPAEILFQETFYRNMFQALSEDGIAVTQSESMFYNQELIRNLLTFNRRIYPVVKYYFTLVPTYPSGTIGFSFCSKKYDPVQDMRAANIAGLRYYTPDIHKAAFMLPQFMRDVV